MIIEMKGNVKSDHVLVLWFQKGSLVTVGLRTYDGGSRVLNQKVTFRFLHVPRGGGGRVTGLGLSLKFYQFLLLASLSEMVLII